MSKILIDTCAWIDFLRSEKGILGSQNTSGRAGGLKCEPLKAD